MISQSAGKFHQFESAVFIVLFFLFISAFTVKPEKVSCGDSKSISYAYLLAQVTALNNAQQVPYQKTPILFSGKTDFISPLNDCHKIMAVNRSINHSITVFQKTEILIKPFVYQRLYYNYHIIETDDPPALS